jgi:hypothetical protein
MPRFQNCPRHLPTSLARALRALGIALTLALAFTSPAARAEPTQKITAAPKREWVFPEDGVTFDSRFTAAHLSDCQRTAADTYTAVNQPENRPINASPWFAFRVSAKATKLISIRVTCDGTRLRYIPKISVDGAHWIALPPESFTPGPKPDEGTLRIKVGPEPLWVAAQEIISGDVLEAWSRTLERLPFVSRAEIGRSVLGNPLYKLELNAAPAGTKPGWLVVVSRQHPPETTGSQALMSFIETIVADTPLAKRFREKFAVLLVPLVNPDGVDAGHWRHNAHGVDTNRDWGVWDQPETRAVRDAIYGVRERGPLCFHVDFHSNFIDDFYTQPDDEPSTRPGLTAAWIDGIKKRVPTYKLKRSASRTPTATTSHNWAHREFGIPTCTYEIGDNTDRLVFQSVASVAAESLMEQLLAAPFPPPAPKKAP